MKFAIIADDNTGATDAAGMLTQNGVSVLLLLDLKEADKYTSIIKNFDAVVLGTQIRSVSPSTAYKKTQEALSFLKKIKAQKIQLKYCSTFDSTPKGNIGQSLDACMDTLGCPATIVCPALPVNGRTTFFGYHFVNDVLLSESSMRDHPINPMTESHLDKLLAYQTKKKIVTISLPKIRAGSLALKKYFGQLSEKGIRYFITDAVEQSDITIIADATKNFPFISGSSGITTEMPRILFPNRKKLSFAKKLKELKKGVLVISGSMSRATEEQNKIALQNNFEEIIIDPLDILQKKFIPKSIIQKAQTLLDQNKSILIRSKGDSAEYIKIVQKTGSEQGLSSLQTGEKIGHALAKIAKALSAHPNLGKLIVSGGETSGFVCKQTGFTAFEVGLPLDPGVPYCFPLSRPDLLVVLKSGNFGSKDLYLKIKNL
jgi:uncharacterized protein YgbK (DUF1537 family)